MVSTNMKRENTTREKRRLRRLIRMIDREISQMLVEAAATPDPARRPLRPEQLN
jgi:hypothetical protein